MVIYRGRLATISATIAKMVVAGERERQDLEALCRCPRVAPAVGCLGLPIMDHQEAPRLHVAATRSVGTALKNTTEQRIRKRVGLQTPHRAGCPHDLEQVEFGHCPCLPAVRSIRPQGALSVGWSGRVATIIAAGKLP